MNVRDRHVSFSDHKTEAFVRDVSQTSNVLDRDRQSHFGCRTILSTKPPVSALLSTTPPRVVCSPPPGTFYLSRVQHSQQLFPVSSPPVVSRKAASNLLLVRIRACCCLLLKGILAEASLIVLGIIDSVHVLATVDTCWC